MSGSVIMKIMLHRPFSSEIKTSIVIQLLQLHEYKNCASWYRCEHVNNYLACLPKGQEFYLVETDVWYLTGDITMYHIVHRNPQLCASEDTLQCTT